MDLWLKLLIIATAGPIYLSVVFFGLSLVRDAIDDFARFLRLDYPIDLFFCWVIAIWGGVGWYHLFTS